MAAPFRSSLFKRQRVEVEDSTRNEGFPSVREECATSPLSPLSKAAHTSIAVAHALGKVGSNVWSAVQSQLKDSAERLALSHQKISSLEETLLQQQIEKTQSEFTSLALAAGLQRSTTSVECLTSHLQGCSADVAAAITSRVDDVVQEAFEAVQSQVTCERNQKSALLHKITDAMTAASNSMQMSHQELLKTRLSLAQSQLSFRRLKAKYDSEIERNHGCLDEVKLLLEMNRHLAEKSKTVESTTQELVRAKHYIRQLEKKLPLPQIVQAIAHPVAVSGVASSEKEEMSVGELAIQDCQALTYIQQEDLTISELVQSWCNREEHLRSMEAREGALKEHFLDLQRQVLLVHHRFLEEKQRREMLDRRLAEVARERLPPPSKANETLLHDLQAFQRKYSTALDDKAEIKASLSLVTDELTRVKQANESLEERVQQLTKDADGDHVGRTLSEMRRFYTQKFDHMQAHIEELQVEKNSYRDHSEAASVLLEKLQGRFAKHAQHVERLVKTYSSHHEEGKKNSPSSASPLSIAAWSDMDSTNQLASRALKNIKELERTLEVVKSVEQRRGSSTRKGKDGVSSLSSFTPSHPATSSESVVESVQVATTALREACRELCQHTFHHHPSVPKNHGKHQNDSFDTNEMHYRVCGVDPNDRTAMKYEINTSTYQKETAFKTLEIMEKIVKEALGFVATHLTRTNNEKDSLLQRSLQDAQMVQALTITLQRLGKEQEQLREKLNQATALIDVNHLTILEHAQMKEIAVEDSIDVAEAADQLALLRTESETSRQTLAAMQEEVCMLRSRCESLEDECYNKELMKRFMTTELEDVKAALTAAKKNEAKAIERHLETENHLATLLSARKRREVGRGEKGSEGEQMVDEEEETSNGPETTGLSAVEVTEVGMNEEDVQADATIMMKTMLSFQSSLQEQLSQIEELAKRATESASVHEEEEKCKDNQLLRIGYSHVLDALRHTCHQLGVLQAAKEEVLATSMKEVASAYAVGEELNVMTMTPEMKIWKLKEQLATKCEEQQQKTMEVECLHGRIQQYEEEMVRMKEREQRLLAMCKKLSLEHQRIKSVVSSPTLVETSTAYEVVVSPGEGVAEKLATEAGASAVLPLVEEPPALPTLYSEERQSEERKDSAPPAEVHPPKESIPNVADSAPGDAVL